MCLCILAHQLVLTHPNIIAANREEQYDRPTDAPSWEGQIFAGRDRIAGGTWQGVNALGLHVALTNRRDKSLDPDHRSRGQLCTDALRHASARSARDWLLDHLLHVRYNPCNLLLSDGIDAFCVQYDGHRARPETLGPGLHMLSETDINDDAHPRIQRARQALAAHALQWPELRHELAALMGQHAAAEGGICLHGQRGGTRSSSLIALGQQSVRDGQFYYAEGPPCEAAYVDLSTLLQQPI